MKRKLRGLQRRALDLDFDLYRVDVPIRGLRKAELSVIDMEPEGAEHCLVFVHGYAGCLETWEAQISAFARHHRVVAPDLRGHGQSDAPYTRYTLDELVADLETVVADRSLPRRFSLVGHSFGGAVAAAYTLRHPDRVSRLVLIATPVSFPLPASVALLRRIPTAVYRPFWRFRPRWNAEPHVLKRMMLGAMLPWDGRSVLSRISVPTLIVTGDRDTYFPRRVFEGSIEAMPEAEVVNVGASKHKVQLERHQAVNRAIARFLDDRASSWRDAGGLRSLEARRPWLSLYPELTPPTVPLPRQAIDSFLERAAENLPKRCAIHARERRIHYQALDRRVNQVARALHGLGLEPGDRVLFALPNCPELVMGLYGAWRAGCVVVLPSLEAEGEHLVSAARDQGARLVFIEAGRIAELRSAGLDAAACEVVGVRLPGRRAGEATPEGGAIPSPAGGPAGLPPPLEAPSFIDFEALVVDVEDSPTASLADADSPALVLMSRDHREAVRLNHGQLVANAVQIRHWLPGLRYGEERCLSTLPLAQSLGLTLALNLPLMLGATIGLRDGLDVEGVLESIRRFQPSFLPAVPSVYAAINQRQGLHRYRLDRVKLFISGAAPLPVEVHEAFEKLSKSQLIEVYGMREACALTHATPPGERRFTGLIGLPLPNTDARVVDERSGEPVAAGSIGEIQVRGPQVSVEAAGPAVRGPSAEDGASAGGSSQGWRSTGDLGVVEVDGAFRFLGRAGDCFQVGDTRVFPRDIEETLVEHHDIQELVVVLERDLERASKDGALVAYVVPRPGVDLVPAALRAFAERRLPTPLVPARFELRSALPKDALGRIDRGALDGLEGIVDAGARSA